MASILDTGLISLFSAIFIWLLVFSLTYGALSRLKPFGDKNMNVYALIAFCAAMLTAAVPQVRAFVSFVSPWFIALAITIFFILFVVSLFGLSAEKDFPKIIDDAKVKYWLVILSILIIIGGLAFTFGQSTLEAQTGPQPTASDNGGYVPPGTVVVGPGTSPPTGVPPPTTGGVPEAGQPGSTATGNYGANFLNTIIHPKVLGLLVTLLIACLAVYFLSSQ